jgi:hypothetical protein
MPLQSLDSVTVDGVRVPVAGYCHDPVAGWVSLAATPPNGATIVFHYQLSAYPDLAVTNWDPSHGNHLFLNTNGSAVSSRSSSAIRPSPFVIYPNPVRSTAVLRFAPLPLHPSALLRLFDASGRLVRSFIPHSSLLTLDLSSFPPGLYFAALGNGPRQKLVKTGR